MKKLTSLVAALSIALTLQAESPEKISYQAIIRNTKGELVKNQIISLKISIYFYNKTVPVTSYVETHTTTTNENGLVNIEIGTGTVVTGVFADLDWAAKAYYLKTEIDLGGRTSYSITSDTQILSVPYALHAKTASNAEIASTALTSQSAQTSAFATEAISAQSVDINGKKIYFDLCIDADNNIYKTVKIGNQVWMAENLRTTKYRNGTSISKITSNTSWEALTTGAWCNYNNKDVYGTSFGHLYNWYAISNINNIAPFGWHVPTDEDWTTLENFLIANGGNWDGTLTGDKIAKSIASFNYWDSSTTTGAIGNDPASNNITGFSAYPGGYRLFNGSFIGLGGNCQWWTSTESSSTHAWCRYLGLDAGIGLGRGSYYKNGGFYVRCVKD
jgi:uncharacterized protein (TIGR02145 family)